MAHTSINISQVKSFLGEHNAPYLFSPTTTQQKNGLALALSSSGEKPVDRIRSIIYHTKPLARIFEITAPNGKDSLKQFREFLSEVAYRLGEPPLRHGQETATEARLSRILSYRFDYFIVDHAECMGIYSLEMLRKVHAAPAVFLVAYDDRILDTLLTNEAILNRVFMLS